MKATLPRWLKQPDRWGIEAQIVRGSASKRTRRTVACRYFPFATYGGRRRAIAVAAAWAEWTNGRLG